MGQFSPAMNEARCSEANTMWEVISWTNIAPGCSYDMIPLSHNKKHNIKRQQLDLCAMGKGESPLRDEQ